ncbi:MAG: hypothetical protein ACAH88_11525, partial [Roseimicrobium sp.]
MSRRTKFLITALFLALLCIPLGYAWVAWRPVNPLSFQVVGKQVVVQEEDLGGGENDPFFIRKGTVLERIYEIEVRNASAATIRLIEAHVQWSASQGPAKHIGNLDMVSNPLGGMDLDNRTLLLPA